MSALRERLIGALNSDPGVYQTSVDGAERYVHERTSVVADAVLAFLADVGALSSHPDEDSVTAEPDVTWPGDLRTESRARASRELIREANAVRDLDGAGIVGRLADMLAGWLQVPAGETVTTVEELPIGSVFWGYYYPKSYDLPPRKTELARVQLTRGRSIAHGERMEYPLGQSWERIEVLYRPTPEGSQT